MADKDLNLNGVLVRLKKVKEKDYVSLQDIAKGYSDDWQGLIKNWIRRKDTIEYLGIWESLENDNFKRVEFDLIKSQAGVNRFRLSPNQWVERTNAIGIIPAKRGRYSLGAFAQRDIAMHFCYWLSPPFQLYLIREFDRLKTDEQIRLGERQSILQNTYDFIHPILKRSKTIQDLQKLADKAGK